EGVPDGFEDVAAVGLDGRLEAGIVTSESEAHGVGVLLPELGAPLDVGEQEGDRAGGQVSHPRAPPAPRRWRPPASSPGPPPTPPRTPPRSGERAPQRSSRHCHGAQRGSGVSGSLPEGPPPLRTAAPPAPPAPGPPPAPRTAP